MTKISELVQVDTLADNDVVPVVDDVGGTPTTKKATAGQVRTFVKDEGAVVLPWAASVALDLDPSLASHRTLALDGDTAFTTTNLAAGRAVTVRVTADEVDRALTFPVEWTWLGVGAPTELPAFDVGILTLASFGSTDADVVASFVVENQEEALTEIAVSAPLTGNGSEASPLTMPQAGVGQSGYLDSVDFNEFVAKENALTFSAPLSRTDNTISLPMASSSVDGALSSGDWTIFNNKGDVSRSGTPLEGQIAVFDDNTVIVGNPNLTWDSLNQIRRVRGETAVLGIGGYADSESRCKTFSIQTSPGALDTLGLVAVAIPEDAVCGFDAHIVGRSTDNLHYAFFKVAGTCRRVGSGSGVIVGTPTTYHNDASDANIHISGINGTGTGFAIAVRCGVADTTMNWSATVRWQSVSGNTPGS